MIRYDCSSPDDRALGLRAAARVVRTGGLLVLPTDTVYGIGADAFSPAAVSALLAAKGRGRDMPPPVLIGGRDTVHGLVSAVPDAAAALMDAFWPGALTLVLRQQSTLAWDLGDTKGTVAVRMPLHPVALDLLTETGPLAVSSANKSGRPAATTVDEAAEQLGDDIEIYLDAGRCADSVASTIVDCTSDVPRVLRQGAIPLDQLREVVADVAA